MYCYAFLPLDFLEDERHQLYWITDVVQITRSFLLEPDGQALSCRLAKEQPNHPSDDGYQRSTIARRLAPAANDFKGYRRYGRRSLL